jgi:peroxiredoxin Q/BCP
MLSPGAKAPPFKLDSDDGQSVELADFKGRKVVLFFYPKDDTPGCTVEACEFRDNWVAVTKAGATVLGVSPDAIRSHAKFKKKFSLPFPLLTDPDHRVADAFGVWGDKSLFGVKYRGILRTTFVIDERGRIAKVFERVKPRGHAREVLEAVR